MLKDKTDNNRPWLKYLIAFGISAVLSFGIATAFGLFRDWKAVKDATGWNMLDNETKNLFVWINATFIVGVLEACFGALVALADGGAFTFIAYGIRRFISIFQKDVNKIRFKTYYDYKVYHDEKPKKPFLFLILVGLLFVVISLILLIPYMNQMGM